MIDRPSLPAEFNLRDGATPRERCAPEVAERGARLAVIAVAEGRFDPSCFGILPGHIVTGQRREARARLDVWVEVGETRTGDTVDGTIARQIATDTDAPWLLASPLSLPAAAGSCKALIDRFGQAGGASSVIGVAEAEWPAAIQHCKLSVADGRVNGVRRSFNDAAGAVFAGRAVIRPADFGGVSDLHPFCPGAFDYQALIDRVVAPPAGALMQKRPGKLTDCRCLPIACRGSAFRKALGRATILADITRGSRNRQKFIDRRYINKQISYSAN